VDWLHTGGSVDGSGSVVNETNKQNEVQQNMQASQQTPGSMGMPPYMPGMPVPGMTGYPGPFPPMMGMRPPPGMPGQYAVS
jgi:hypothetical protein